MGIFTGLSTGSRAVERRVASLECALEASFTQSKAASHAISVLEDRLATLEGQHKTLRGRFYSAKGDAETTTGDSREARKAAAFAKAGWVPGSVPKHS
jgi:septal ring factor EnvC (AmiA/AmiB activator)